MEYYGKLRIMDAKMRPSLIKNWPKTGSHWVADGRKRGQITVRASQSGVTSVFLFFDWHGKL